ncbi:MAG: hypothetical protein HOJ56_13750 [Acidimicrobiaceae bacterium]|nr:hypothetical protein [Acidimicrobiaceae bacterium]
MSHIHDDADDLGDAPGNECRCRPVHERCLWRTAASDGSTDDETQHDQNKRDVHPVGLFGAVVVLVAEYEEHHDRGHDANETARDASENDGTIEGAHHRAPRVSPMHELVGTETMTNLWEGLASAATTAMLARQLAEHADVEGQPEAAVALRALADRETGLATGLVDFLVEDADGLSDAAVALAHIHEGRGPAAAKFRSMAATARAEELGEVGAWLDKLADAQHDHQQRLTVAINGLR